jgi:hypothetical protein
MLFVLIGVGACRGQIIIIIIIIIIINYLIVENKLVNIIKKISKCLEL